MPGEESESILTDEALLKALVADHHKWTGSLRAREILDHWAEARGKFVKVFPHEFKRVLGIPRTSVPLTASPAIQPDQAVVRG